ncbi:type IV pilin protein [Acinetobacter gandensis]|nr:type IV pilin protein [Acinetobacter gandensis]
MRDHMESYNKGFTLIELMIVVVILGILAAIAYPSYTGYQERGKRVEAQTVLLDIAQQMSAYKVAHGNYDNASSASFVTAKIPSTGTENYSVVLTVSADKHSWTLEAIPANSMVNTGALTLDSSGQQCWEKTSGACDPWDGK